MATLCPLYLRVATQAHWTIILKRFILAPFLGALRPRSRSACENSLFTLYFLFFVLRVLRFLPGLQIPAYQPADSGAGLLEHQGFGGRLQGLYCRGSSAVACCDEALAPLSAGSCRPRPTAVTRGT